MNTVKNGKNHVITPSLNVPETAISPAQVQAQVQGHTEVDLLAEIQKLRAENAKLKATPAGRGVLFRVSKRGGISAYGLNARFPVTLYKTQWEKLLGLKDVLVKFMEDHDAELSTGKDDARFIGITDEEAKK
jgi:hypothetical protein